jgi:hypothetical protein
MEHSDHWIKNRWHGKQWSFQTMKHSHHWTWPDAMENSEIFKFRSLDQLTSKCPITMKCLINHCRPWQGPKRASRNHNYTILWSMNARSLVQIDFRFLQLLRLVQWQILYIISVITIY